MDALAVGVSGFFQDNLLLQSWIKARWSRFMPRQNYVAAIALCALASSWPLATLAETSFIRRSHPIGQFPAFSLQVDLNNDGIPDLLTTDRNKLTSLLSGSVGSFTLHDYPSAQSTYQPLASGDFNGDGKADVLFYNPSGGSQLYVLAYGDGKGNFTSIKAGPTIPGTLSGQYRDAWATAFDATGDGRTDALVAYKSSGKLIVELWKNTGTGLADAGQIYSVTLPTDDETRSSSFVQLLLGDYDGDGFADIALNFTSGLTLLYGNGAGHFTAVPIFANSPFGGDMNAADMDEDGRTDLVWINEAAEIHLFTGQVNRTLKNRLLAKTPSRAVVTYRPQLADFSGNGWKDIAFALESPGDQTSINPNGLAFGFRVLFQTTPGNYTLGSYNNLDYFLVEGPGDIPFGDLFTADYNQDGRPDINLLLTDRAFANPDTASLELNAGTRRVGSCPTTKIGIHVCSPGALTTTSVPISFSASAFYPLRNMEVWVDGVKRSETHHVFGTQGYADVTLTVPAGTHKIALYAVGYSHSMLYHTSFSITAH